MDNCNIMLIGFMGTGKTTVSKYLSKLMNIKEVDMDKYIVDHENMEITDIFAKHGEEYFRNVETMCLKEIQKEKGQIVSCGGGAVLKDENVSIMKDGGIVILLTATPNTVYERVKNGTDRPILNGHMNVEYIDELMQKRKARYEAVADVVIETDDKEPRAIAMEIMNIMEKKHKK